MSQYPDPYSYSYPSPYGDSPYGPDPQAPARRAGMLMIVLGILMLLGGVCIFGFGWAYPLDQLPPEQAQAISKLEQETGVPVQRVFIAMGVILALPSLLMLILGLFVRRGGMGSIVTSMILVGLMILVEAMYVLMGILQVIRGQEGAMAGLCMMVVPLVLLVVLMVLLIQAVKNVRQVQSARQYSNPYWMPPYSQNPYDGTTPHGMAPTPPPHPRPDDQSGNNV
ncbi:MAG: hypothetical protein IT446_15795 [Phycisphaerales bacterium]|nr:hypothetical protein [Phycisphaerales bacterium]